MEFNFRRLKGLADRHEIDGKFCALFEFWQIEGKVNVKISNQEIIILNKNLLFERIIFSISPSILSYNKITLLNFNNSFTFCFISNKLFTINLLLNKSSIVWIKSSFQIKSFPFHDQKIITAINSKYLLKVSIILVFDHNLF
jgi:hypothetical protein